MIRLARETLEIGEGVDVDSALSLHPGVSEAAIAVVYRIPIKYVSDCKVLVPARPPGW